MNDLSSLSDPKKLNIKDFPPERKRRKEGWWKRFRRRQKQQAKFNKAERALKRLEKERNKRNNPGFFAKIVFDIKAYKQEQKELRIERAKLRKHQPGFFKRLKLDFQEYRIESKWKNRQALKRRAGRGFWLALFLFFLGPLLDFRDEWRAEREEKKKWKARYPQPNIFQRLWLEYLESRDTDKQRKQLDKKVRLSLSYAVDEEKRIYSLRQEVENMKKVWRDLPWSFSRDMQNVIVMTVIFVFAFGFNFGIFQLAKFLVAAAYGIPSVWREGQIVFTIPDPSPLWTYSSVLSVYSVGPFVLLLIGSVFQRLQKNQSDQSSVKSLLFLWIYVHAYILVFGTFLAGYFTDRGFGYVMGWMYIPWIIEVPLALLSVVMLWVIGYKIGRKFLIFRHSNQFIDGVLAQLYFKFVNFYVPIIFGLGILFLIGFNDNDFTQNVVYLSVLTMLTPTLRFIPEKI